MNTTTELLKARTKRFGLAIITFVNALPHTRETEVIGKQLIRAALSVGANYRAACRARSQADFVSKIGVVEEEADESGYWLEILRESQSTIDQRMDQLLKEANELTAIFAASEKTARRAQGSSK